MNGLYFLFRSAARPRHEPVRFFAIGGARKRNLIRWLPLFATLGGGFGAGGVAQEPTAGVKQEVFPVFPILVRGSGR
jgi:hypothetical protein